MDYNDEPIYYCSNCLSLHVTIIDGLNLDVCQECGNTDIETCHVDDWNKLYVNQYNKKFLEQDFDSIVE